MSRPTASTPRRLFWSRWLVLALLSLTLPLQGALAATMGIGMALMSPHPASAVMTMPSDCQDMTAMDMAGMDPGAMSMDHASPHDDGGNPAPQDHHHCGICLQCCLGAAMPITPLTVAAQDLRDAAPSLGALGAPAQSPQPLERPPKAFLA
jgi:hypothetical protein